MTPARHGRRCEVCERPLNPRTLARTGLCTTCRKAGAAFLREWANDLTATGLNAVEVGEIVGLPSHAVRFRLRDRRIMLEAVGGAGV